MDATDRKILKHLEHDARISFAALSEAVGLSKTPCWSRVKDMENAGIIQAYRTEITPKDIGIAVRALIHVVVDFEEYEQFEQAIIDHPNVRTCHAVTGEFDYVLEVLAEDMEKMDALLRTNLSHVPGVQRFNTSISMRMVKSNGAYWKMLT